ncbi:MAG: hypothetical protein R3A46_11475 [Thermomicrobiales bacterium]
MLRYPLFQPLVLFAELIRLTRCAEVFSWRTSPRSMLFTMPVR